MNTGMRNLQRKKTDSLLFDYYLVSSPGEMTFFSPYTHYLPGAEWDEMVSGALTLDALVRRLLINASNGTAVIPELGAFPLKERILALDDPGQYFWVRYDSFRRSGGGYFFSEINYDKPCAQREVLVSERWSAGNSKNLFENSFRSGLLELWRQLGGKSRVPSVVVMAGPSHYEEVHLAFLYADLLRPLGWPVTIAGPQNFSVSRGKVMALGRPVDLILRQYPTEYLHQVNDIEAILDLCARGRVILVNHPRAVLGQTKALFAALWRMVEQNHPGLSKLEKKLIIETIPYTVMLGDITDEELFRNKDRYLLKSIYSRYSQGVYPGVIFNREEWAALIKNIRDSVSTGNEKTFPYIAQEYIPVKREAVPRFTGKLFKSVEAGGNLGIYLTRRRFAGVCVRWSEGVLTETGRAWFSPVNSSCHSPAISRFPGDPGERRENWRGVNDASFARGFTGGYTGEWESFSLDAVILPGPLYQELVAATNKLSRLFGKIAGLVKEKPGLFFPLLGIGERLADLITEYSARHCAMPLLGRMDWALDVQGRLKLLEFNAETPAGLMESLVIGPLIRKLRGFPEEKDPNLNLHHAIREQYRLILNSIFYQVKNIGFVSSTWHEDWYTLRTIFDLVKDQADGCCKIGEAGGISTSGEYVCLNGETLDALYRYYPLEWFSDPLFGDLIETLARGRTLLINPPDTLITQSKAFLALAWELKGRGFYAPEEEALLEKYVPFASLDTWSMQDEDFVVKPYFQREGAGVRFGVELSPRELLELKKMDVVFQRRVEIAPVTMIRHSARGPVEFTGYPVLGAFVVGNNYGGLYTRVGGRITDRYALYVPAFTVA